MYRPPSTPLKQTDPRLTQPVFTVREAAGYLALPASTVQRWTSARGGALVSTREGRPGDARVPFIGFTEAYVLGAFRRAGVPMQRIRPVVEKLAQEIGLEHALASRELYTDGEELLMNFEPELFELTVVRTGQKQFSEVVREYLTRITFGDDGWAERIQLPAYRHAAVIVDPRRAFGQPYLEGGGARVEDLVDRFVAGDALTSIARDFGAALEDVEDVIRVATQAAQPA